MRISDDFKDYYDNMLNLFMEEAQPVYIRKQSVVIEKNPIESPTMFYFFKNKETKKFISKRGVIAFCGKGYPFFEVATLDHSEQIIDRLFIYDQSKIVELAEEFEKNKQFVFSSYTGRSVSRLRDDYKNTYDQATNSNWFDLHVKYKSPILLFCDSVEKPYSFRNDIKVCVVNPCLRDYEFVKVVDPYSAIQSIEMYLSNELAIEQQPIQITDDKIKAIKAGFGHQYAFRKEPGGKK